MSTRYISFAAVALSVVCLVHPAPAQESRTGGMKKNSRPDITVRDAQPTPTPAKRNERPSSGETNTGNTGSRSRPSALPAFRYEFSQPEFPVTKIRIEHDERGSGTIEFAKKGDDELITDPITVSPKALARINDALTALNFLDATENYQYEKDYSHLGNIKFARTRDGKSREVAFNYTTNPDAKTLMDEYRKIANQYIWIFDIKLARENQPLESPKLMDSLDGLIRRNEISDPYQLESFLRELSNDESIPLIARNHAGRLVKQFEKDRAKEDKKRSDSR